MNHLPIRQNTQVALHKAKSLIGVTDRILAQRETNLEPSDDAWIERLFNWADEKRVPDLTWIENKHHKDGGSWSGLPRNRQALMQCTKLILWRLDLACLPPEIGNLVNLKSLELDIDSLTELPPEIGNLVNLKSLELFASLTKLPPEIGKLVNLKNLELYIASLTELPPEIGKLVNLENLWLSGDHFTELPPEIGNLVKLESFVFYSEELTELPPEIGKLVNLIELSLYVNKLTELPTEICNLKKLKRLDLRENQLCLTADQEAWIARLKSNGCEVVI